MLRTDSCLETNKDSLTNSLTVPSSSLCVIPQKDDIRVNQTSKRNVSNKPRKIRKVVFKNMPNFQPTLAAIGSSVYSLA